MLDFNQEDLTDADVDALDSLWKRALEDDALNIVADTPAWLYLDLLNYVETRDFAKLVRKKGRELWFHLIACGGPPDRNLANIGHFVERWHDRANILLWDNEFYGQILGDVQDPTKHGLVNTRIYDEKCRNRVRGVIKLAHPDGQSLYDIQTMLAAEGTFREQPGMTASAQRRILRLAANR